MEPTYDELRRENEALRRENDALRRENQLLSRRVAEFGEKGISIRGQKRRCVVPCEASADKVCMDFDLQILIHRQGPYRVAEIDNHAGARAPTCACQQHNLHRGITLVACGSRSASRYSKRL